MRQHIACFGLVMLLLLNSIAIAQPMSSQPGRDLHSEWTLWQIADDTWYFRLTVGALANVYPGLPQPTGFARITLGLSWTPEWLITPQVQVTKAMHEIGISLEGVGNKPTWVIEFTPFVIDFEINLPPSTERVSASLPAQPQAQPEQQAQVDLKALVLTRLDDLLKAGEQIAKENPSLDLTALRDPLTEFKKAFEANKMDDAAIQLDAFSVTLLFIQRNGLLTKFQEMYLRAGLHRLVSAFALFREQVQRQKIKVCTGLFVSEDQKSEEVLSPMLTDVIKKLTFTNTKTGAKETFTLKESRCF
uniref:Uncharacterized protein n=1 Tax=Acetithermum autotrophicum TaxID=1446466 RepID=H5SSL3_ACEAU|nr:hypothetical protein HGMM_OP3C304 [Candidatus Acetothermum autotrophicum]